MKATKTVTLNDDNEDITISKVVAILMNLSIDENQCDKHGGHWFQIGSNLDEDGLRTIASLLSYPR